MRKDMHSKDTLKARTKLMRTDTTNGILKRDLNQQNVFTSIVKRSRPLIIFPKKRTVIISAFLFNDKQFV